MKRVSEGIQLCHHLSGPPTILHSSHSFGINRDRCAKNQRTEFILLFLITTQSFNLAFRKPSLKAIEGEFEISSFSGFELHVKRNEESFWL
jgi:hypothetical protein